MVLVIYLSTRTCMTAIFFILNEEKPATFFSLLYATQGLDCRIVEFFIIYYMFPKTKMI